MDESVKNEIGRKFRALELVSEDWFGGTYEAKRIANGRPVLLRVMHTKLAKNTNYVKQVQATLRKAVTVAHPNLAKIITSGKTLTNVVFFAYEKFTGETLRDRLNSKGKIPTAEAVGIALQILSALHALDRRKMIHGYLHPSAIYLTKDHNDNESVKLLDYGILDLQEFIGEKSIIRNYISPVQALGEGELDIRTDIFSVGLILFELLSRKRAYESEGEKDVSMKIILNAPPSLGDAVTGLPSGLLSALDSSLAHDYDERVAKPTELMCELSPYCENLNEVMDLASARSIDRLLPTSERTTNAVEPKKPTKSAKPVQPAKPQKPPKPVQPQEPKTPPEPVRISKPITIEPSPELSDKLFGDDSINTMEFDLPILQDHQMPPFGNFQQPAKPKPSPKPKPVPEAKAAPQPQPVAPPEQAEVESTPITQSLKQRILGSKRAKLAVFMALVTILTIPICVFLQSDDDKTQSADNESIEQTSDVTAPEAEPEEKPTIEPEPEIQEDPEPEIQEEPEPEIQEEPEPEIQEEPEPQEPASEPRPGRKHNRRNRARDSKDDKDESENVEVGNWATNPFSGK